MPAGQFWGPRLMPGVGVIVLLGVELGFVAPGVALLPFLPSLLVVVEQAVRRKNNPQRRPALKSICRVKKLRIDLYL